MNGTSSARRTDGRAATAIGTATIWASRTKLPPSGFGTRNSTPAAIIASIAVNRTTRLLMPAATSERVSTHATKWSPRNGNQPESPNSTAATTIGSVAADVIATASRIVFRAVGERSERGQVASATAIDAIARNTAATGLTSGVRKAAVKAAALRCRSQRVDSDQGQCKSEGERRPPDDDVDEHRHREHVVGQRCRRAGQQVDGEATEAVRGDDRSHGDDAERSDGGHHRWGEHAVGRCRVAAVPEVVPRRHPGPLPQQRAQEVGGVVGAAQIGDADHDRRHGDDEARTPHGDLARASPRTLWASMIRSSVARVEADTWILLSVDDQEHRRTPDVPPASGDDHDWRSGEAGTRAPASRDIDTGCRLDTFRRSWLGELSDSMAARIDVERLISLVEDGATLLDVLPEPTCQQEHLPETVVCATGAAPVNEAIDGYVGAGCERRDPRIS